jgi:hypothetical protein
VSATQYGELRANICAENGCWETRFHTDAQVTADAGAPWRLLLAEDHYKTCAAPSEGGHLDAVGVWPQAGNNVIRLIEIKATPEVGSNLQQKFDKTARAVLGAITGPSQLQPELHVLPGGKLSIPYQFAPKISGKRIPVRLMVEGKQVGGG